MTRNDALKRIRKCLALATSNEPHEAAAALRQAQALMEKFDITDAEASLSDITEASCRSSGKKTVPLWEAALAKAVGESFGCRVLHSSGKPLRRSYVRPFMTAQPDYYRTVYGNGSLYFVGVQTRAEIARYAFEALRRQLRKARAAYRSQANCSGPRLEAFVIGWVMAVQEKIDALAKPTDHLSRADDAIKSRYGTPKDARRGRDRSGLSDGNREHMRDAQMGALQGREAELNTAVGFAQKQALDAPSHQEDGCRTSTA